MGLLAKHPMSACTRPVLRGAVSHAAEAGGGASGSAGRQSSGASSSSHYHWQQSGPSSRATPPMRPLSRFAEPASAGRGVGYSRSLSSGRLGASISAFLENAANGGQPSWAAGAPAATNGESRPRMSPHLRPGSPQAPTDTSPAFSQLPSATAPHHYAR